LNHKLGTACETAGVPLIDAHRAMNDVEANTELVRFFLRLLRGDGRSGEAVMATVKERARATFKF
jgi:DNA polymerase III alpha subunit (gram-positive type)